MTARSDQTPPNHLKLRRKPTACNLMRRRAKTDESRRSRLPCPADVASRGHGNWNESPWCYARAEGAEVIQPSSSHLPNQPGVAPDDERGWRRSLCGKPRSLKRRVTNYAQGRCHTTALPGDCATTNMENSSPRGTKRGAAAVRQSDPSGSNPVSTCLSAMTIVPLSSDHRITGSGDPQHRGRRARARAALRGAIRLRREPWARRQCVAAGVLLRTCTDAFTKAAPGLPALFRFKRAPAPARRSRCEGLCGVGWRGQDFSRAAVSREKPSCNGHCSRVLTISIRARWRLPDRLSARLSHVQSHSGLQSADS